MFNKIKVLVAAACLASAATGSWAMPVPSPVTITPGTDLGGGAWSCLTSFNGYGAGPATDAACLENGSNAGLNDKGNGPNSFFASNPTLFGLDGWTLADDTDGDGDGAISFASAPVNGTSSGTWSVSGYNGFTDVLLVLKAGKGFGAFKLDVSEVDGAWGSIKNLSHAAIWYTGTPVNVVPLPAGGLLLLSGLGLLALRRRK